MLSVDWSKIILFFRSLLSALRLVFLEAEIVSNMFEFAMGLLITRRGDIAAATAVAVGGEVGVWVGFSTVGIDAISDDFSHVMMRPYSDN